MKRQSRLALRKWRKKRHEAGVEDMFEDCNQYISFVSGYTVLAGCGPCSGDSVSAASPLIVGCGIAYFVNILMRFYERHYFSGAKTGLAAKSRRPVCMIAAFLTCC